MTLTNQYPTQAQTTQNKRDSKESKPPALVQLELRHAFMLSEILKRTHRASRVEQDWLLHTIEVIDAQLKR